MDHLCLRYLGMKQPTPQPHNSATVQITTNYENGSDVLDFADTATITGVFAAATGTLTLSGQDTVANYQAALRAVTFENTSQNPSLLQRTVTWIADDGAAANNLSAPVTSTINIGSSTQRKLRNNRIRTAPRHASEK